MPYVITTITTLTRETADTLAQGNMGRGLPAVEAAAIAVKRAVVTLDEARDAVYEVFREQYPNGTRETGATEAALHASGIRSVGGAVGPLPNGTVIEVTRASCRDLSDALPIQQRVVYSPGEAPDDATYTAEIVAAYNVAKRAT